LATNYLPHERYLHGPQLKFDDALLIQFHVEASDTLLPEIEERVEAITRIPRIQMAGRQTPRDRQTAF